MSVELATYHLELKVDELLVGSNNIAGKHCDNLYLLMHCVNGIL